SVALRPPLTTVTPTALAAAPVALAGLALAALGLLRVVPGRRRGRAEELDDVVVLLLLGRRQDGDDRDALHVVVGVDLDPVAHGHAGRDEVGGEDALRFLRPGGAPGEGPVTPVAGELDLDPSGHTA